MKVFFSKSTKLLIIIGFVLMIGCNKDDENDSVPDPLGTMSIILDSRSNETFKMGLAEIKLTHQSNLEAVNCEIMYYGKINGLGNITKIPQNGWSSAAAANPNTGYVVRLYDGTYGRFFISDIEQGTYEAKVPAIGGTWRTFTKYIADTKYQYPFNP